MKPFFVSLAQLASLKERPDADKLLLKPQGWDFKVIPFSSREALEAFNKKAKLKAVVLTQVPLNCAVHPHQSDSDARQSLLNMNWLTR